MNKSYDTVLENNEHKLSSEELALINLYSRKKLTAEDVFVFSVILCDNDVDRDFERFTVKSLNRLAELFVGKTAIKNHSMNSEDQTARTFKTEVITDKEKLNSLGEPYTYLKAYCYIPRIKKYESIIEEIEAGIKKEVSIGCSVEKSTCSICNTDSKKSICKHKKGKFYNNELCYFNLENPVDAYEWSFVAVPAQRNAGVIKSFKEVKEVKTTQNIIKEIKESNSEVVLTKKDVEAVKNYITSLEEIAQDGRSYRNMLESETVKLFALMSPEISNDCTQSICKSISTSDLRDLNMSLKKKYEGLSASQLSPVHAQSENKGNLQFRL